MQDLDARLCEDCVDTHRGACIALHACGQQSRGVIPPGMNDAVTARTAPGIGRALFSGQPRIMNRVLLALVADAPVTYPPLQDSRCDHEFRSEEHTSELQSLRH